MISVFEHEKASSLDLALYMQVKPSVAKPLAIEDDIMHIAAIPSSITDVPGIFPTSAPFEDRNGKDRAAEFPSKTKIDNIEHDPEKRARFSDDIMLL